MPESTVIARRYIAVLTSSPAQVPAYLYETASVVATLTFARVPSTGLVVVVEATSDRVEFVAQYQADRLLSGLHGARVHATAGDALADYDVLLRP